MALLIVGATSSATLYVFVSVAFVPSHILTAIASPSSTFTFPPLAIVVQLPLFNLYCNSPSSPDVLVIVAVAVPLLHVISTSISPPIVFVVPVCVPVPSFPNLSVVTTFMLYVVPSSSPVNVYDLFVVVVVGELG